MNSITKKLVVLVGLSGVFAGNSFSMQPRSARYQKLYAELRKLQIAPPKSSPTSITPEAFAEIFRNAHSSGLIEQYKKMLTPSHGKEYGLYQKFLNPEHLQWVAYLENKHGEKGPFTYDPSGAGKDEWDNPVLGTYVTSEKDKKIIITRYGMLKGLFNVIDDETFEPDDTSFDLLQSGLKRAIYKANTELANMENDKQVSKRLVEECQGLYKGLLAMQKLEPIKKSQLSSALAFNVPYDKFFLEAVGTEKVPGIGLIKSYKNMWCADNEMSEKLFNKFVSSDHLQWVAYLQNKHGKSGPFTYDSSGAGTNDWDNPVVGTYKTSEFNKKTKKYKKITITRYGFFKGLLDAINQFTDKEWGSCGAMIKKNLELLKDNLQKASSAASLQSKMQSGYY